MPRRRSEQRQVAKIDKRRDDTDYDNEGKATQRGSDAAAAPLCFWAEKFAVFCGDDAGRHWPEANGVDDFLS
jgi:hypothetical protein